MHACKFLHWLNLHSCVWLTCYSTVIGICLLILFSFDVFQELSDIKTALNSEIEQLRSDFQELRTTLKKQQEDVSNSLKNLGVISSVLMRMQYFVLNDC